MFNLNDPGWGRGDGNNNSGSEPPRKPGKGDGPPDLDEVWRDFNDRLGSLFGRKPRRGGNFGGNGGGGKPIMLPKGSPKLAALIILVLVVLWLASGFMIVQEGQVAVVTRFGKYTQTLPPGLQWRLPYPVEDSQMVNISRLRTFEIGFRGGSTNKVLPEALMLTNDENIVDVQFVVQYRLEPGGAPDYLFRTSHPDEAVRQAAETAMREVVGKKPMDHILYSGRAEVAAAVQKRTQALLDEYQTGIEVSTVAIQNVQPPEQVQAAFDDAVKAGQDRERQINEGMAYSKKVIPEAQGEAARMIQQAQGYKAKVIGDAQGNTARFLSVQSEYAKAPEITRERLYLSTMQDILQNTSKVVIDSSASNNLLYLPLDQVMKQAAGEAAAKSAAEASDSSSTSAAGSSGASATSGKSSGKSASDTARHSSSLPSVPDSLRDTLSLDRFSH
jgi:membrane protease subunit HflK